MDENGDVKMEEKEEDVGSDEKRQGDYSVHDDDGGVKKEVNGDETLSVKEKERGGGGREKGGTSGIRRSIRPRVAVPVAIDDHEEEEDEISETKKKKRRKKSNAGVIKSSKKKAGDEEDRDGGEKTDEQVQNVFFCFHFSAIYGYRVMCRHICQVLEHILLIKLRHIT